MRSFIPHFQGNAGSKRSYQMTEENQESETVPYWYAPATGGIEQRLDAWALSSRGDGLMGDVVREHFSQPVVATHLANDLLIEATAAEALSRVQNPPDEVVNWWARRIYQTYKHWDGPVGDIVKGYNRTGIEDRMDKMLAVATHDLVNRWNEADMSYSSGSSDEEWKQFVTDAGLPIAVGEALLVAKGYLPPPDKRGHKLTRAELRAIRARNRNRGTGAPTGDLDLSIANEPRTWTYNDRNGGSSSLDASGRD